MSLERSGAVSIALQLTWNFSDLGVVDVTENLLSKGFMPLAHLRQSPSAREDQASDVSLKSAWKRGNTTTTHPPLVIHLVILC